MDILIFNNNKKILINILFFLLLILCNNNFIYCDNFFKSVNSDSLKGNYNLNLSPKWITEHLTKTFWAFSPDHNSKNTSALCSKHVKLYREHLKNNTLWAVQMFDSSALSPHGILSGDSYQLGNFDQCININVNIDDSDNINGKYCLIKLIINPSHASLSDYYSKDFIKNPYDLNYDPYSNAWTKLKPTIDPSKKQRNLIYWAVCVPSSCNSEDIDNTLKNNIVPKLKENGLDADVNLHEKYCHVKTATNFTTPSIIFIWFIVISLIVVVLFSLLDMFIYRNSDWEYNQVKSRFTSVMLSYSVYQNFLNLKRPESSDDLTVIHGMRTYSTILVMLGHRCMFTYGGPFHNPEFLEKRYRSLDEIFILNGFLIVDTFFTLSGFLTCYMILLELDKNRKFNLFLIYLHRWLRLTPLYAIVIALYATILPLLGDGPLWNIKAGLESERCFKNWWSNILYLNTYLENDICMFQSWFLTCDMHFFLFGPILAYLFSKRPKLSLLLTTSLLIISIIVPFVIIYQGNLDGILKIYMSTVEDPMTNDYVKNIYIKSHNRAGPYIVGILAGYLYYKLKKIKLKFSRLQISIGVVLCTIVSLTTILSAWIFYIPGREYNVIENALYSALHRIIWSIAMSWIVIAGGTTGFGVVSPILYFKSLIPLSRLTYAVFLIHGFPQLYFAASMRVPEYVMYPKLIWMWMGDVTIAFIFALILHLLFEAPISGLVKILLLPKRPPKEENTNKKVINKNIKNKMINNEQNLNSNTRLRNTKSKNKLTVKTNLNKLSENVLPEIEKKKL